MVSALLMRVLEAGLVSRVQGARSPREGNYEALLAMNVINWFIGRFWSQLLVPKIIL